MNEFWQFLASELNMHCGEGSGTFITCTYLTANVPDDEYYTLYPTHLSFIKIPLIGVRACQKRKGR